MMSTLSTAEAAAPSSSRALNAPRFQFLKKLTHRVRPSNSLASEPTAGTQPSSSASPLAIPPSLTAPAVRFEKIPYMRRTVYVFPDACNSISKAHRDRFPALKDIIQRNIEDAPNLSNFPSPIGYQLLLCGPHLEESIPSIVIFCPLEKLRKLKSLLTQPHIKSQFQPETTTSEIVGFGLFFWGQSIEMLAVHEVTVAIPEREATNIVTGDTKARRAPWGVHIVDSDSAEPFTATMSCLVQIAGVRFGLITAHAFHRPRATSVENYSIDSDDTDAYDDEYDTFTEQDDRGEVAINLDAARPFNDRAEEVRLGKIRACIPPREDTSVWAQKHADLDWALLDMGFMENQSSVSEIEPEALPIASHLPPESLDVLIMTRAHGEVHATMYNIPSFIGGVKGSPAAEVWTVSCVSEGTPILKGDSGSMVIGARAGELYGMVVAANPLGDIHIVPFAAIIAQIEEFFGTHEVSIHNLPRGLILSTARPEIGSKEKENGLGEQSSAFKESQASSTRFGHFVDDMNRIPGLQYQGHSTDGDQRRKEMAAHMNLTLKKFEKAFRGED